VRGRTRLALGRCHVRQAADGSGVGQLLEYEVRFSQVLARRQRRQRRRQRRLRWRRERRLPSGSARPRDITGDQKIECWLNVLGLGIPREMRDLSCSKPKNFPACRRLSEVRGRAVHAVREGAPQPPWVPLTADPARHLDGWSWRSHTTVDATRMSHDATAMIEHDDTARHTPRTQRAARARTRHANAAHSQPGHIVKIMVHGGVA